MTVEYAILVKNKTRLERLIERFNTAAQAKFYIEHSGGDFADYEREHEQFHESLASVQRQLSRVIKNKIVEQNFLPAFLFNDKQVVIVVGQDGLVANTAKYVNGIPIIAVNPDSERYDGVLLPFTSGNFIHAVETVQAGRFNIRIATLAEAKLNQGQRLLAFNDLFVGAASHVSARYLINYNQQQEEQSSSGIIVSTQAGSTGWLSSVFNMSYGIQQFIEPQAHEKPAAILQADQLMFAVREPFQSKQTQADLVAGILTADIPLKIESLMPVNGVIFSDGIESDFLQFNSGAVVTIGIAEEKAALVVAE
ncbi:MAG: sugar kinase [Methylococcales bacterium]|nr:sugar kinase [Methylococcales bacterium]